MENVQEKLCYGVPLSKLQVFRLQPLALPSMSVKFWKTPEITCAVEFIFTEAGVSGSLPGIYPRSLNNVRFVEEDRVLNWESDREVIVVAAGGLTEGAESLLQQAGFPIMGALPSHQIISPPHESLSSSYCKPTCFFLANNSTHG